MRKELLLDGSLNDSNSSYVLGWKMHRFLPGEGEKEGAYKRLTWHALCNAWMEAEVPGDVHTALVKNGAIEDPYIGRNNRKCEWIADYEWWFQKRFNIPKEFAGKRARVLFEGVDYNGKFWLNGNYLGEHEGMFSPIIFNAVMLEGRNDLSVCLAPPPKNRIVIGGRKCNLGYGVDYAPEMLTLGIWRSVRMIFTDDIYIADVHVTSKLNNDSAELEIDITSVNDRDKRTDCTFSAEVEGDNFKSDIYKKETKTSLAAGENHAFLKVKIPLARLWWPWDMGEQNLYVVRVKAYAGDVVSDEFAVVTGIRDIRMLRNPGSPDESHAWTFSVNGKKEYIRGACWTNTDILHGGLNRERYEKTLSLAKEANINMLRVHGWHLIETPDFYDICNRMGILVWQEFSFCNTSYPQTADFLEKVRLECSESVKMIRNHPSLAVWCGGNEYNYRENEKLINTLGEVCKENDPARWFIPVSDLNGGYYMDKHRGTPEERPCWKEAGDNHSWEVWIRKVADIETYAEDESLFVSEFGLQSVPCLDTLKKFIPDNELRTFGPSWKYHSADIERIKHYAYQVMVKEDIKSLEDFIKASQMAQARGLKFAIEHFRRRKYRNSGCIFWQFNEPWPSIVWSVVDWYLQPKAAYYAVKNSYSPVLINLKHEKDTVAPGEILKTEVWIINDYHKDFKNCRAAVYISDFRGRKLEDLSLDVDVAVDSARKIREIEWEIPEDLEKGFNVELRLTIEEIVTLSQNYYEFRMKV